LNNFIADIHLLFRQKQLLLLLQKLEEYDMATAVLPAASLSFWRAKTLLALRRYSGDVQYDGRLAESFIALEGDNNFDVVILYAENAIFSKKYDEANDILQKGLADFEGDTSCVVVIYAMLGRLYSATNNFKEAVKIAKDGVRLIVTSNVRIEAQVELYQSLVQAYLKSQDYNSLETYATTLLDMSRTLQDTEKEIVAMNSLAVVSSVRSDFKTAMGYFINALDLGKVIGFRQSVANTLINIGTIYAHLQNLDDALHRYLNIIQEYEDILEINTLAIVYNNVGNIYFKKNDTEQARFYFGKALAIAEQHHYQEMIALSLTQMSRVFRAETNTTEALIFAEKARHIATELDDMNGRQINIVNLGQLHYDIGDFDSAILLTREGLMLAEAANDESNMLRAYELLAEIFAHLKDFEQAFIYQHAFTALNQSIELEQRSLQAIDIEIKYDLREKQLQIEQLKLENEYQAQLLSQSNQIAKQNTQLSRANEELQQFAYVVSHDLKEPLRMIASYIQLIMRRLVIEDSEEIATYSGFINEGVSRMNNLLDGLLQYATIGEEKEEPDAVALEEVIEYAIFNLKLLIRETDTKVNIGEMPTLNIISTRLVQVFQNLISNAIKFRKPDSTPIINISCERQKKDFLFKVSDNGIGIDKEHRDRIFVIFQRLHTRKQYEGTGIGLSICQKIIIRSGGKIWVEGEVGVGTTFCFTLPLSLEEKSV
jgi:signal transduction histidine kinase/tetratricopeptide (TPR) repeat protein